MALMVKELVLKAKINPDTSEMVERGKQVLDACLNGPWKSISSGTVVDFDKIKTVDKGNRVQESNIEPFKGTDFSKTLGSRPNKRPLPVNVDRESENKTKRPKLAIDLYTLIPKPHHLPYPCDVPEPVSVDDVSKKIKPFPLAQILPVLPRTLRTVREYLGQKHARSAWIVPLEGTLPWPHATAALITDAPTSFEQSDSKLTWSAEMITKFWTFLLTVREVGAIGVISLVLHIADRRTSETGIKNPPPLLQCSHIKIWHDAELALYVRTALSSWRIEETDDAKPDNVAQKIKIKPLNKTKLVLLDESFTGVMIC